MVWNENEHPRDDIGRFTFKNGRSESNSPAEILYGAISKIGKEKKNIKNELLNILGSKATQTDILYGDEKSLLKKIKDYGLKGEVTGGASSINSKNCINQIQIEQNFSKPAEGSIRSEFGPRKQPKPGASVYHSGIDLKVPIGTPIKSVYSGKVIKTGIVKGYGYAVYIDHGIINGKHVTSEYGHLSKINVKVGDKINSNCIIAKSGNTGRSTGPHLHITIRENGVAVNPRKYIKF